MASTWALLLRTAAPRNKPAPFYFLELSLEALEASPEHTHGLLGQRALLGNRTTAGVGAQGEVVSTSRE